MTKVGDSVRINGLVYFDEASKEPGNELYEPNGVIRRPFMFRPKEINSIDLVCTSNVGKDINHIIG